MGAVTDHKANTSLTALFMNDNRVGDAGASALADALKATVLMCKKCVFRVRVRCHRKCCFMESSEELASSTRCAVCDAACVIFFVVRWGKFIHVCVAGIARGLFSS